MVENKSQSYVIPVWSEFLQQWNIHFCKRIRTRGLPEPYFGDGNFSCELCCHHLTQMKLPTTYPLAQLHAQQLFQWQPSFPATNTEQTTAFLRVTAEATYASMSHESTRKTTIDHDNNNKSMPWKMNATFQDQQRLDEAPNEPLNLVVSRTDVIPCQRGVPLKKRRLKIDHETPPLESRTFPNLNATSPLNLECKDPIVTQGNNYFTQDPNGCPRNSRYIGTERQSFPPQFWLADDSSRDCPALEPIPTREYTLAEAFINQGNSPDGDMPTAFFSSEAADTTTVDVPFIEDLSPPNRSPRSSSVGSEILNLRDMTIRDHSEQYDPISLANHTSDALDLSPRSSPSFSMGAGHSPVLTPNESFVSTISGVSLPQGPTSPLVAPPTELESESRTFVFKDKPSKSLRKSKKSLTLEPTERKRASAVSESGEKSGECALLWEFLHEMLSDDSKRDLVRWSDKSTLTFHIENPNQLACLWGDVKGKGNMTYEKMSRALRYYYKMKIIEKVPGRRLTYRYITHPTKIVRGIRGAKPGVPHRKRKQTTPMDLSKKTGSRRKKTTLQEEPPAKK